MHIVIWSSCEENIVDKYLLPGSLAHLSCALAFSKWPLLVVLGGAEPILKQLVTIIS